MLVEPNHLHLLIKEGECIGLLFVEVPADKDLGL